MNVIYTVKYANKHNVEIFAKNYIAMITVILLLQHLYMLFTLGQIMAQSITSAKYFLGYIWAMRKFFSTIG